MSTNFMFCYLLINFSDVINEVIMT